MNRLVTLNAETAVRQQTFALDSMNSEANPTGFAIAHSPMPNSANKKTRPEGRANYFRSLSRQPSAFTRAARRDIFRDAVFL